MAGLHEESVSTALPATGPFATVIVKSIDVAVQEVAFAHVFVIKMVGVGGIVQLRPAPAEAVAVHPLAVIVTLAPEVFVGAALDEPLMVQVLVMT
jgi:hypothetical protein